MTTREIGTKTTRIQELETKLFEDLPNERVAKRRGPSGTVLEYLSSYTATDELNRVFGPLGWDFEITSWEKTGQELVFSAKRKKLNKVRAEEEPPLEPLPEDVTMVGIECRGRLTVLVEGMAWTSKEDVGYGEGLGINAVRAHADAGKQARSDCLKRCAKDLGYRLGLALYDKEQSHVTTKEQEKNV